MNANCYRIIFNKKRGQLMVVAETATGDGKSAGTTRACGTGLAAYIATLRPLAFSLLAALGLVLTVPTQAQVVAYKAAPGTQQPTILTAGNGVPLINIQTPSAAGVSRNLYSQFDVQTDGVILNNARNNAQTQLGGWIQGNPWLATGSARVILNEVLSANPSQLLGYVEVAGASAQVVIANPAGITCSGCGFINASRATLTTGTPQLNGGDLTGYRVDGGNITVQGKGMDASGATQTDLIARAVQINAGLWANTLNITTGTNHVSADNTQATPVAPAAGGTAAPAFALDVAQLGGMYAGKITLVGTEAGVGVRNAGQMGASAGDVVVTVDGQLTNSGTVYAQGKAAITSTGAVNNAGGTLVTNGDLAVQAAGIDNSQGVLGTVAGNLTAVTGTGTVNNASGQIQAGGDLALASNGLNNTAGLIDGRNLQIDTRSQTLDNGHGALSGSGSVDVQSGALNNDAGLIQASGALTVNTHAQTLTNTNSDTTAGIVGQSTVSLATGNLNNSAGFISGKDTLTVNSAALSNTAGARLISEKDVQITGTALDNQGGQIQAAGSASAAISGTLDNTASLIRAGQGVTLTAAQVINRNTRGTDQGIEGKTLAVTAAQITNTTGALRADQALTLTSAGTVDNTGGLISSAHTLDLLDPNAAVGTNASTKTLDVINTGGTLIADERLRIDSRRLTGDGAVLSSGDVDVKLLTDFTHTGQFAANGNASLETTGTLNNQAKLQAGKTLTLKAGTINNASSGEIVATTVKLNATDSHTLTNRGLIDGSDTFIDSATVNNLGTGRIYGDHVAIAATTLTNTAETVSGVTSAPVIAARGRLDIGATTINNREHGLLFSAGDMSIGGALDADHKATGQAGTLNNASATIEALGNLALNVGQINNTNEHFSTKVATVGSKAITEYQGSGSPTRYVAGATDVYTYNDESTHLHTPEGNYESWSAYRYTRTTTETQVATSDPGKILAGGSIGITADALLNRDSQIIAGGAFNGAIGKLTNDETPGERKITDSGTVTSYWRNHRKGRDNTRSSTAAYTPPATIQAIALGTTVYKQGMVPTGTGTTVSALNVGHITQVATGTKATDRVIRTITPTTSLPNNSLFTHNPNSANHYLIETDPRFASYRTWLSSDYMLSALSLATTQERLGDGFYEQRLVGEQVAQLTGRRFLDGYADDEAQYAALMNAGVTYAKEWKLIPGVGLTEAQMASLTSDMVWLVEKDIDLGNGQIAKALVPQIYVRVQPGDLVPSTGLLAGNSIDLDLTGDLTNRATIAGRQIVSLTAENIQNLGGRVAGQNVLVAARNDLNNVGGTLQAEKQLIATAGHDLTVASTTRTQTNAQGSTTNIDRVAGLYVTGEKGILVASAGNDMTLLAAALINSNPTAAGIPTTSSGAASTTNPGGTLLIAGHDLNLGTVEEATSHHIVWDGKNKRDDASQTEVGTTIQTSGDLSLQAGNNLTAKAASVTSEHGALTALAGNDLTIEAGYSADQVDEAHRHKEKGFLSTTTRTTRDTVDQTTALASTFSGNTTALQANHDIKVTGSNVVATGDTTVLAGHDITIEAATEQHDETHFKEKTKSGLMSSGGIGFTIGTRMQSTDQNTDGNTAAASTIGSTEGNVLMQAGHDYRQVGSDVITPQGSIGITAQRVDIEEARERSRTTVETKFKQSGLTVAITSPVISAIQTAQQMMEAASDTKDTRMKVLAAANTGFAAYNAYDAVKTGQGKTIDGYDNQVQTGTNPEGKATTRDATADEKAGGVNISISLGSSSSSSKSTQTVDNAVGSTLMAGKDIQIVASGAGADSDITIQGSRLAAGNNLSLKADDEIKLLAAANTAEQHSTNKSSSGSVGVSFGTDGLMFNIGASAGKGKANGDDVAWANTELDAGRTLTLQSGGDTTLKGAVARGEQVIAKVGGDLNIESLQDTSTYDSKQKSGGFSLSIGYGKMSGSVSYNQSKINSDYASVTEQSGFKAGDGGFQVDVKGDTDLKGAVIASTQKAIDDDKNSFKTAMLTTSDIQNHADYKASSIGVNIGTSMSFDGALKPGGTSAGVGKDSDSAHSTTKAGISGVAGNTETRTGDKETGITRIFDAERVQKEIDAQVKITQTFGQQASKAVGDYAKTQTDKADALFKQAEQEPDKTHADELKAQADAIYSDWGSNGALRIAAHTVIGGLTGGVDGAVGSLAGTLTAPLVAEQLEKAGITGNLATTLTAIASTTAGGLVGGSTGAGTALNEVTNNFLGHESREKLNKLKAKRDSGKKLSEQDQKDIVLLEIADQTSDGLLTKYLNGGILSKDERLNLATYLGAFERQDGVAATIDLLKNGPNPTYGFPYAGTAEQQKAYMDALAKVDGGGVTGTLLAYLFRDRTKDENVFNDLKKTTGMGGSAIDGVIPNEAYLPTELSKSKYEVIDALLNSPVLATGTYLGGTALGVDKQKIEQATVLASIGSDILSSFAISKTGLSSSLGSNTAIADELTIAGKKVFWVEENAGMSQQARDYNDSATGAQSNPDTKKGLAPALERTLSDGTTKLVKFDGVDGEVLVDRKISVVTTNKSKDQALRQSEALSQNGLEGRWEVSSETQANRAIKMLNDLGISNIKVKVVKP